MFGFWPQLSRCRLTLAIALGRMALTTIRCRRSSVPHCFLSVLALFMKFNRLELVLLSFRWLAQTFFSAIWLRFWRQTASEWLWRQPSRCARQIARDVTIRDHIH
ncbi:DUF418 domain-containing protein [Salmonella enterica subsp. enterica]|nr:DUF418 domain-containing protein [Salmonella enterica subsp. enterica]